MPQSEVSVVYQLAVDLACELRIARGYAGNFEPSPALDAWEGFVLSLAERQQRRERRNLPNAVEVRVRGSRGSR
jgi:hypothetical protein